jgi:chloramphenicol 3-O phosphotransferase
VAAGRIVVLNGPSSAGKSTLAKAVRDRLGPSWAAVSVDRLYAFLHPEAPDRFAALNEAGLATAVSFADRGFDVVIESVFEDPERLEAARRALADRVWLIAVTCPIEALEARERARGNRRLGLARDQHERVLQGAIYDLRLDTARLTPEECVDQIATLLSARRQFAT